MGLVTYSGWHQAISTANAFDRRIAEEWEAIYQHMKLYKHSDRSSRVLRCIEQMAFEESVAEHRSAAGMCKL